jgi:hypothetical protein
MKINAAIDSSVTKEVPLDVDVDELVSGSLNFAPMGLGASSLILPA